MKPHTVVRTLILLAIWAGLSSSITSVSAEDAAKPAAAPAATRPAARSMEEELAELKNRVAEQQATIEKLTGSLEILSSKVNGGPKAVGDATSPAPANVKPVTSQGEAIKSGPLAIRIGDADFTVGGFMDFTAFFRSTNLGSGIGSSFGSLPYSNTAAGRLTESRFSAQNSRVTLKAESKVGANKVTGYLETDFLGFQPTTGFVTSNSNSLRMRLYWVDVQRDKFEVLGGQSWSLLTPNRTGLSPNPSDLFFSQNMDTNYQVGLTWSRQAQVRFVYHPSATWAVGLSAENPEQFLTGAVALPGGGSSPYASQVDIAGTGGSTSTPNSRPDIIAKIAYDPTVAGKHLHFEVAGLLRSFKTFNAANNVTNAANGEGGSVNINLEATKKLHLIANTFYSQGGGRYIFGLGPDFIVRPDGTPSPIHAGSGIAGFEYQLRPSFMVYSYYGGAFFERNTAVDAGGKLIGFGFPGSASSSNRSVQEATFGFVRTFWKNPRYGALQWINQFSYLTRSPWSVATGAPKNAHLGMAYMDLRYVLP